jgi:hypothetical protein
MAHTSRAGSWDMHFYRVTFAQKFALKFAPCLQLTMNVYTTTFPVTEPRRGFKRLRRHHSHPNGALGYGMCRPI